MATHATYDPGPGNMSALGWIDWTVFSGYLVVVLLLGLWFMRGQETSEDYFVGGRPHFFCKHSRANDWRLDVRQPRTSKLFM